MQAPTIQRRQGLLQRLSELGIVTPEQIAQAVEEQAKTQERLAMVLVRQGVLRTPESGKPLALQIGWIPAPLDPSKVDANVTARLAPQVCQTHRVVPLYEQAGCVVLASDDPLTVFALEWLERHCGMPLDLLLVREQDLNAVLPAGAPSSPVATPPPVTPDAPRAKIQASVSAPVETADEPIIRLVDSLLQEAVRLRASDIHIEPLAARVIVRYRIDGVLHEVNTPPKNLQGPITSRIKIMAGLDIAEKRLPQDGRLQLVVDENALDVRISTLPALHGESLVLRLLNRNQAVQGLRELGLAAADWRTWEGLIQRSYGMILVTGPTGSGKTTTLYATLAYLNRPERKLITVEDPVEYQLQGVNQVHVKSSIGLTFAAGLRAMLRQAPDIIMVGEIRDRETAQVAIQAALTGHLVFSTLHTNDAAAAVTRLIDMGVAPFLVASTIQGVMAQRLVRRICATCRAMRPPTPEERVFLGDPPVSHVAEGLGCPTCHQTGYYGRVGLYELLVINEALRQLIASKRQASTLREQALRDGMHVLRDDGRAKVRDGLTTMTEVLRATPESAL